MTPFGIIYDLYAIQLYLLDLYAICHTNNTIFDAADFGEGLNQKKLSVMNKVSRIDR